MDNLPRELESYLQEHNLKATANLGNGQDGDVWKTDDNTAVKRSKRKSNHDNERRCYLRFEQLGIQEIDGFNIPELVRYDDDLLIVEMTTVSAPYIVDFGKTYIDRPPDFTPEVWSDWEDMYQEIWEDRWPIVRSAMESLKSVGIYYMDPHGNNVSFGDDS